MEKSAHVIKTIKTTAPLLSKEILGIVIFLDIYFRLQLKTVHLFFLVICLGCFVFFQDAFTGCQILPCSHKVHKECATRMIRSGM